MRCSPTSAQLLLDPLWSQWLDRDVIMELLWQNGCHYEKLHAYVCELMSTYNAFLSLNRTLNAAGVVQFLLNYKFEICQIYFKRTYFEGCQHLYSIIDKYQ